MIVVTFISAIILFIVSILYQYTTNYNYWSKRNVKHDVTIPVFGSVVAFKYLFRLKSAVQILGELCDRYPNEKIIGMYIGCEPRLIVKDPDLIKHIFTDDFEHFHIRGFGRNLEVETLHKNPLHADGDMWKLLRQSLSPVFTSAKLKAMFPLIIKCTKKLEKLATEIALGDGECEIQSLLTRFTLEITGTCGFGLEVDMLKKENAPLIRLYSTILNPILWSKVRHFTYEICPFVRPFLYVSNPSIRSQITEIVQTVMKQREYKPSARHDFIDCMIKLLEEKTIRGTSFEETNPDGSTKEVEIEVDIDLIVAQVFVFFAAGSDTSITSSSHTLHYLAFNPEIQLRVQEEIDRVMFKYNNELTYDSIADMVLLKMSFFETMRLFPPAGEIIRVCTKTYTFPGTNVTINPGIKVSIPIQEVHKNPAVYKNAGEFIPERFLPENIQKRHKYSYIPFGAGPRMCIGSRMGEMQALAGLAAILHKFTVEPSSKSTRNLKIDPTKNVVQGIVGGLPLKLKLREQKN